MENGIDVHAWEKLDGTLRSRINRRRLLQLIGYGTAGMVGAEILAACGGTNPSPPPPPVNTTSTPATSVTATVGTPRQLPTYFLGYNNVPIHSPSWQNPDVVKAAAQMKPGTLRYPGGTVANYWDWQTGWFLRGAPGSFKNAPKSIYRLQELQTAVNATGAVPIYVLNMLTSDLNTQMEMLRTAKSMGLPVKFVELGNEFYLRTPDDYVTAFPTGADYGKAATTWIQAIRTEFPDAKIAAVGGIPVSGFGDSRKGNWNNDLLQNLQGADALTLHPYVPLSDNTVTNGASTIGPQLNSITSLKWQQFENEIKAVPGNMTFWITEYNFVDSSKQVFYHWIDGIFATWMTLNFLTDERVELACYYDMIGQTGNEVIYYGRQAQGNSSGPGLSQFALTSAGWAMRLLGNTISGMTSAAQITFDGDPSSIQGWLFSNGSRQQAFIINSGSDSFACAVSNILPQAKNYQQLTGDPLTIVTGPGSLTATNSSLSSQLTLPAYSVTQVQ